MNESPHNGADIVVAGRAEDGSTVEITAVSSGTSDAFLERLEQYWPPRGLVKKCASHEESPTLRMHVISKGSEPAVWVGGTAQSGGWDRIESTLGLFAAEHLAHRVAVHAALISTDSGVIVLPGPTHSGKSTLVWSARERGLAVLSDEFTLIDSTSGLVQGWPRPIRRRVPAGVERSTLSTAECEAAFADQQVAVVACIRFDPSLSRLSNPKRSDAVLQILENTVCAHRRPGDSFHAALAMTRNAVLLDGTRTDTDTALDVLLDAAHQPRH